MILLFGNFTANKKLSVKKHCAINEVFSKKIFMKIAPNMIIFWSTFNTNS